MAIEASIQATLKRDRWITGAGLLGITTLAWLYMLDMAGDMPAMGMESMGMATMPRTWGISDFVLMFFMWAVMMVAMMIPSAAPTVLLYGTVAHRQAGGRAGYPAVALFTGGYLLAWGVFSFMATALQWGLERAALLSPMMVSTSPYLGGGLLIAAGLYQWTPLKRACLDHCRSPIEHLSAHWRSGPKGAVVMGLHHGAYCLGCCGLLMGLLFVLGVMNLLWVAAVAWFVFAEKLLPGGASLGRAAGAGLVGWGSWILASAFAA